MPPLSSLKVTYRCLQGVQLDLTSPETGEPSPFVALVGANGTGKTSMLDFIANEIGRGRGAVTTSVQDVERELRDEASWLLFQREVVLALTPNRHWFRAGGDMQEARRMYDRILKATLYVRTGFLPLMPLYKPLQHGPNQGLSRNLALHATTPEAIQQRIHAVHQWWLHQHWEYPRTANLDRLWQALAPFLGERTYAGVNPEDHLPRFQVGDTLVGFNELSSGERRVVLLFLEIAMHCGEDGLLLFDEPEAHFHPSWQRLLPEALVKLIPRGQIIVATHSPFIVEGLAAHQVFAFGDTPW